MRPSVTSATRWPRSSSTPSAGVSLCSSGIPFALGPWWRTTATTSRSSSPALEAAGSSAWSSNTRAGASITRCSGRPRPSSPRGRASPQHPQAAVGGERRADRAQHARRAARRAVTPGRARRRERRRLAVALEPAPADRADVGVQEPASSSSPIRNSTPPAAWNWLMSAAPFGYTARAAARRSKLGEVVPGQRDPGRRGDRHQVHRVVGRAAGGQQRDDAVDDARSSTISPIGVTRGPRSDGPAPAARSAPRAAACPG